jgi:hypothetical protein
MQDGVLFLECLISIGLDDEMDLERERERDK